MSENENMFPKNLSFSEIRTSINYLPYGIALFDTQANLILANSAYKTSMALPQELVEQYTPLIDILMFIANRGDLGPGTPKVLAEQRWRHVQVENNTLTRRVNALGRTLEINTSRNPEGGFVISLADITERAKAEHALEQMNHTLEERVNDRTKALTLLNAELERARAKADTANHEKTRFLAAASHDLLQPLNAARLYTSTLFERTRGTQIADLASSIDASLNAVEEIMSTLLDISRMDSGAFKVTLSTFNILELLRKIEVEFQPLAAEKSISLKVVGASMLVKSDRMLLARLVQNLVSNAIKYTREGGKVLVGCRIRGQSVRIDVIDNGIGIDRHQFGLIFNEFSRLEQGARIASGLGLGLSIVQRLANALDHVMEIDSAVGRGTRFSLTLPRTGDIRPAASIEPTPMDSAPNNQELANLQVLCVDNERSILDAMAGLLQNWGCDIRIATSLKEIAQLNMLEGWVPDLVLMDYHLDQTSGLDAIEWLKQIVGWQLPAILVTADKTTAVRELAELRGISVLNKPVKPAALRALITHVTRNNTRLE